MSMVDAMRHVVGVHDIIYARNSNKIKPQVKWLNAMLCRMLGHLWYQNGVFGYANNWAIKLEESKQRLRQ